MHHLLIMRPSDIVKFTIVLLLPLLHDDVRRREEHGDGGDDGEGGEGDEAEPVNDHGRELPVHDDLLLLVADLHPVRDELELLQDALQLAVGRGRAAVRVRRRRRRSARVRRVRSGGRGRRRRRRRRGGARRLDQAGHDAAVLFHRVVVHADEAAAAGHRGRRAAAHPEPIAASGHRHRSMGKNNIIAFISISLVMS